MLKLNILIVSHSFPPFMNVGGMRAFSWAKYWSEAGHNVTILTSKSRSEFSYTSTFFVEVPEGVKIIEIENPLFKYFNKNSEVVNSDDSNKRKIREGFLRLKRSIVNLVKNSAPVVDYYFDWYYKSVLFIKKNKKMFSEFDFVISTANPLSAHSIGMYLKENHSLKWIADYRDLEEQSMINGDIGNFRRKYINLFKNRVLKTSDLDITVSEGLRDILLKYQKDNKVEIIYNGFFEENYHLNSTSSNPKWQIVYSGSFYENQFDINPLFQSLELLKGNTKIPIPEVIFYGSYSERTKRIILGSGSPEIVEKVVFKSSVSNTEIAQIQISSAILLLIDNLESKGVLLTKSYEYLATQRPIIAIVNPESELATNFLNENNAYYVGFNPVEMMEYIEKIYNIFYDYSSLDQLTYYDTEQINFYSRKNQAMILLEHIKETINTIQ